MRKRSSETEAGRPMTAGREGKKTAKMKEVFKTCQVFKVDMAGLFEQSVSLLSQ